MIRKLFLKIYNYFLNFYYNYLSLYLIKKSYVLKNNKKIFSIRNYGGSTKKRADTFFSKEPETVRWLETFGEEQSSFLDVGANIGIYSIYAAKLGHKVISIEPEFNNFQNLNENIIDNNLSNFVKAYPICFSDKISVDLLRLSKIGFGKSDHQKIIKNDIFESDNKYEQGTISFDMDTFLKKILFYPNFIKIDVDGNEFELIKGMTNTISKNNKFLKEILIEVSNEEIKKSVISTLEKNNFFLKKTNYHKKSQNLHFVRKN
jgi:FkbM family methyltransferase